jgi:N6-L-threonylcarbamoyladenine synthase
MPLILGIESSCDETSASVVEGSGDKVSQKSLVILSQDVHRIFGGIVPELASRAHVTSIVPVVQQALTDANCSLSDLDAVAVTYAPGLIGALLVGVCYGKALAFGLGKPLVPVHHMEGHIFASALEDAEAVPPFTCLLVSGGHTLLLDVPEWGSYKLLGATRDDAAGEAFDKVAKLLGLPYPGGRPIEELAKKGDSSRYRFSRPMLRRTSEAGDADHYAFSFSGLKTAALNAVKASTNLPEDAPHIARAFQDSIIETLAEKVYRAATQYGRERVILGGGVACNRTLVAATRDKLAPLGVQVFAPSPRLATDNAAMIARAGIFRLEKGDLGELDLNAFATMPLPGLIAA